MALAHSEQTRFTSHEGNGSSAARTLQEALHLPRKESWWKRYFKWENNLTVAGKIIEKGFVITPTMGLAIVLAFLGTLGWAYKSSTADFRETRDAIIRMETTLNERTRNFERQQDKMEFDLKNEKDLAGLFRDQHNKEMWEMKRALSESGIKVKQ